MSELPQAGPSPAGSQRRSGAPRWAGAGAGATVASGGGETSISSGQSSGVPSPRANCFAFGSIGAGAGQGVLPEQQPRSPARVAASLRGSFSALKLSAARTNPAALPAKVLFDLMARGASWPALSFPP